MQTSRLLRKKKCVVKQVNFIYFNVCYSLFFFCKKFGLVGEKTEFFVKSVLLAHREILKQMTVWDKCLCYGCERAIFNLSLQFIFVFEPMLYCQSRMTRLIINNRNLYLCWDFFLWLSFFLFARLYTHLIIHRCHCAFCGWS